MKKLQVLLVLILILFQKAFSAQNTDNSAFAKASADTSAFANASADTSSSSISVSSLSSSSSLPEDNQAINDKSINTIPDWANQTKVGLTELQKEVSVKLTSLFNELLPDSIRKLIASYTPTRTKEEASKDLITILKDINLTIKEKYELIRIAIANGGIIDASSTKDDDSLLIIIDADLEPEEDNFEIVKILIDAGANVNKVEQIYSAPLRIKSNNSPLLRAVYEFCKPQTLPKIKNQLFNIIELLLQKGAAANLPYTDWPGGRKTPLILAAVSKEYRLVQLLLKYKADPKIGHVYAPDLKYFSDYVKEDKNLQEIYDEHIKMNKNNNHCNIQ